MGDQGTMNEFDSVFDQFFGPKNDAESQEHEKIREETAQQFKRDEEAKAERRKRFNSSMAGLGTSAALMGGLMGGIGTMFGMNDGKHDFREYVHATIDGFMSYLEVERDENKRLKEELSNVKEELEQKKEHYDDAIAKVGELNTQLVELTAQINIIAAEKLKAENAAAQKKAGRKKPGPKPGSKNKKKSK